MTTTVDIVYEYGSDQWELLPEGGGGYVTGIISADDGTMYCRNDVCGFHVWKAGDPRWKPIYSLAQNFEEGTVRQGYTATWDIACSPTHANIAYVMNGGPDHFAHTRLYRTTNYGDLWEWTGTAIWGGTGQSDWNYKLAQQKCVVDPNNELVVYVGCMPQSDQTSGILRAIDGVTFEEVAGIPHAQSNPGTCGIVFDRYAGTVTVSGQVRTARLMFCVSGEGWFESIDGGVTFNQVSEDTTPSNTQSITTTVGNCMVVAMLEGLGTVGVRSIKMDGVAMTKRISTRDYPGYTAGLYCNLSLYYANAVSAGSHTVVVEFYNGSKGFFTDMKLIAVADVDPSTPWIDTPYYHITNLSGSVTSSGTAFYIALSQSADTAPTSGWTALTAGGTGCQSQYTISTGEQTATFATGLSIIVDALKQKSSGTIALNAQAAVTTSGASDNLEPSRCLTGKMTSTGTLWTCTGPYINAAETDDVWRYKDGVWLNARPNYDSVAATQLAVDRYPQGISPGPDVVHVTGPQSFWYGDSCFNADDDVPVWVSSTFGASPIVTSPYVPWQLYAGASTVGEMEYSQITGKLWHANGLGIALFTDVDYGLATSHIEYEWRSEGIEELVATFALEPPEGNLILACVHDRIIMQCRIGRFPLAYYEAGYDAHAWDIDYSSSDPTFIVSAITQFFIGGQTTSSYSDDSGATWTRFAAVPNVSSDPGRNYGGSGSPHGGCIASASPTNHVIALSQGYILPQYTLDNGATWVDTDLPPGYYHDSNFLAAYNFRAKTIAADRVNIGTFYIYDILTGFHRSTNGGVNWTQRGGPFSNFGSIWPVPGFAGHLFAGSFYGTELRYSTDGANTWTNLPGGFTSCGLLSIGKASPGSPYGCDIFVYGYNATLNADYECLYHGVALGTSPSAGFTWTNYGPLYGPLSTVPDGGLDAGQALMGSWQKYGRVFMGYNSTGHIVFNAKQD